ncbi:MAG TPA: HRDC domain-containing protein [Gemmatimonadaceae bacterium]
MPVELIDNPQAATTALAAMSGVRELAVDTEGASFHRFVDRVYLLQLSTRQTSVIVDPLAVPADALAPLASLVESADVETVFHDADYDLRLLRRDYGWKIRRIFDTRIAAQLLGIKAFGLAALLEQYFGVKLDKKHQRADWSMRPLPRDMLDYAEQDTRYLLELKDRIRSDLERKGRLAWAREEYDRLEEIRWSDDDAAGAFLRVKGARDLSRRELAVLRELFAWRDSVARELDRATFRVIGNEQRLDLSRTQPSSPQALGQTKGTSRSLLDRRGGEMLDAIRRGLDVPEADLPKFPKSPRWDRDPQFDVKVGALKTVRDAKAVELDLDPGVLCGRERLENVARKGPTSMEELLAVPDFRRWQAEVLGAGFLTALKSVS